MDCFWHPTPAFKQPLADFKYGPKKRWLMIRMGSTLRSSRKMLLWLVWHTVRNQRNPVKNHDATDYFRKIDFFVRHSHGNLKQPEWKLVTRVLTLLWFMTAWWLLDDCLMTTWLLPDDYLINAWRLPDDSLITPWWLPEDCLTTVWWLPDDCLTTAWLLIIVWCLACFLLKKV